MLKWDTSLKMLSEKINGAGACVDFLRGRNPIKDTQYAKHERGEWPTD